jgi:hypothetical protein
MVGHIACMGRCVKLLVGQPEGKRPLGRPGHIWEDNIIIHLMEIGREGANCIHLTQDRDRWWGYVNTEMDLWIP